MYSVFLNVYIVSLCLPEGKSCFSTTYPVIKHGMLENPPVMDGVPIETSIYSGFPIAMFDYRRVP